MSATAAAASAPRTPSLAGRRVLLAVSGSIAAYKSVVLLRLLQKQGAEVRVVLTEAAADFVPPLTFAALTHAPVLQSVRSEAGWNNHVELGLWADVMIVAPATAHTLARLANGICNDLVSAVYLSARCPVLLAPAMDVDMWHHPSTQANVQRLTSYGNRIVPVGHGELASGLHGDGRLAEPETILEHIVEACSEAHSQRPGPLSGRRVLVTAGPTREALDPVRFLSNRSSGKMGLAVVEGLLDLGAEVDLVLGPVDRPAPEHPKLRVHRIESAQELARSAQALWPTATAGVLAAAVSDYRPAAAAEHKLKKSDEDLTLRLVRNPDVAASLGQQKTPGQVLVGFALETRDGRKHALSKLERKNLDLIVLNEHLPSAPALGADDNALTLLFARGEERTFGRADKTALGRQLAAVVAELVGDRRASA